MIKTEKRIVSLKDFHCPWCGNIHTLAQKKANSIWIFFQCYACENKAFSVGELHQNIENLEKTYNRAREFLGKDYELLTSSVKAAYHGQLVCVFCQKEISKILPTKNGKYYHWTCKTCKSKGFIPTENFQNWQFISGFLSL